MKRARLLKELMGHLENGFDSDRNDRLKIMISKDVELDDEDRALISDFCSMCSNALGLENDYQCFLSNDRKKSKIQTSAICDLDGGNIRIYCRNRALADILRSIAHEMFHLRQHELELIPMKMKQHHLNPVEWQANAAAGSLLSYFSQKVGRDKIYR